VTGPTPKLFIFPHAGGSAQYYIPFSKTFTADIKRVAVKYPGRGGTHDLASFTSIPDLADRVTAMLSPLDQSEGRVAFFGHSMGGLLAFEVARRFEAAGNPIAELFVSASAAPGRVGFDDTTDTDRGLLEAAAQFTGASPELLENEEFAARILPTLRGFRAIGDYDCPPEATVSCPIAAYLGADDQIATRDKVLPWSERTTSEFTVRTFPGHHFYLNDHLPELVADIEGRILAVCGG
jgi:surfactin synthase thioesterase subunit